MKWLKKFWGGASTVVKVLIAVAAVAVFIALYAVLKNWNIGGFLGKLFKGPPSGRDKVKIANTIPNERVDDSGVPIPHGKPDNKGFTQWVVHEAEVGVNPFRDKSKLKVKTTVEETQPDGTTTTKVVEKEIVLPKGVKDKDVSKVVEIRPDVYVVEVIDTSNVRASDLLDDLP